MDPIAVISDIHANPYALEHVLDDIRRQKIGRVFCLGDIVGYNALPRETIKILREANIPAVKGNHDMMATGELALDNCGPIARSTLSLAREQLVAEERRFLNSLPDHLNPEPDLLLIHSRWGNPVDYLKNQDDYLDEYRVIRRALSQVHFCFTGHTHGAKVVEITRDERIYEGVSGTVKLNPNHFYFINPGSVGYPRRSDYRASYTIFDPGTHTVQFIRVRYPKRRMALANTQHRIATDLGQGRLQFVLETFINRMKVTVRSMYEPKSTGYRSRPTSRTGGYPGAGP